MLQPIVFKFDEHFMKKIIFCIKKEVRFSHIYFYALVGMEMRKYILNVIFCYQNSKRSMRVYP